MGLMSGVRGIIVDAWSWLNYKPVFSDARGMPARRAFPEAAASWVPADDERRLAAYKLLAAYLNNQAAELAEIADGPAARDRREYGDPSQFVDTIQANVLGDEQTIVVDGAEDADTDDATEPDPAAAMAARVQERLRDWAEAELLPMRIQQGERKAVSMGDGVYLLAWDPAKGRVTVRAKDPGFYFPVLPEDGDGEFPQRVHFAWELPADPKRKLPARLRRITYELAPIDAATAAGVDENGRAVRAPLTVEDPDGGLLPVVGPGDTVDPASGTVWRQYAWNDEPSTLTCYLTDATWDLGDLKGPALDVDNLPMAKAQYATRSDGEVLDRLDLLVDFLPVVHVPNTVPEAEEHWGTSSLAKVLQVFDELQGSDTDTARASATTGLPIVGVSGVNARSDGMNVAPGAVWTLGENGKLTTIDTSAALRELREHVHDLGDRAARIARLPAVTLGTLDPSQVPSGYAMDVSLGPLDSLVANMRLARRHKYALLLKMVQRLHIAGQHPDWAGLRPMPAELVFGSYKPTDRAGVLQQVTEGVTGSVISLETGVRMLMDAGFPIADAAAEIERIESRMFDAAARLADALGNPEEVAAFLGRKAPDEPEPPAVQLPQAAPGTENDPTAAPAAGGPQGSGGNDA